MKNFVFLLGILIIFSFRSYAEVTLVLGSETLIGGTSGNTIDVSVTATAPTGYTTGYTLIHIGDSVTQGAFTGDLSANNSSLSDGTYGCWAEQIGILSTHEVTVSVSNIEWVEIDDTPPTLSSNIDSLPSITNDPNLKINVTYFDKNWGSGSIGINASNSFNPPDSSGTNVFDVTLSEGENKFGLAAVDELGNTTTVYDIQNPPITVIYDGTAPTITAIDITPTIASTKVPYKSQDLELKLTFDNEMDKTKTPNVWIICENGGRIDQAPNHPSVWDSSGKIYTCHLTIPYNNGSIIDGDAILNITDFYDKAGNIGANIATSAIPVGSTDLFKIDTTPAKIDIDSAKIDETSLNLTIPITDNVWTKTGGSTKISGSGINKKDGFKLWIDANGDGLGFEDSNSQKEIFTIYDLDDNPTGDKSLTYDGQTLTFYPSLLKSDHPWKVYTAENITVKVILCKDMSGNESIPVSKTIATHLNFKPTSNFVYWDNVNSINAEKTPPNNGTTPDPYQDIQIQFNVNENTKSKLDKSSVVLRINNLRFGLNGSGSADQSPSFIVKESNDTTEILVFSPENAVPPILLKDGKVSVEFSASDEIGQSIDTISTSFDVNTGIPSTTFVYWTDSKTPEKEKTPPQYYQTIQGITPYTDQHIKFQIIPNSTSKIKIDTNEIVLKISFANGPQTNDYFFAPASSDNAYASSAMTFKEITNSTSEAKIIEVDVLPENSTNPLVFPEGEIKAEIVKAQDIYGNNALKTLTSFFVDNTPPSYQPISPLPGQITFDTGEIMGLQAQDTAGQGMGANLKVEITGTTGNPSSGSIEISVTPSDDLKTYNIYLNPNGATYKSPLSNGKCTISGDIHDFLKDNESHKTNVNYSFFCLLNTEITNLQYDEISKEKTTPIIGYISGLTGVDDNTSYLTVVYKINEQSERSQIVYVGPNYQQGDNDKIAPFNINVELESSLNTISFYVADNFGNRSSKIKTITVNWDQSGPASSVLLLDLPSNSKKIFQYNAKFKWSKVEDAKVQKIQIAVDKAMDSIILTKSVGEGITQASVSLLDEPYNTYYAWMTSYDSLGNNSVTSNIVSFKMDRTPPKLNTITINDTTPNNNNTPVYPQRINPGDMKITLSFSEDMDTSVDLLTDNRIQLSFPHLKKYL